MNTQPGITGRADITVLLLFLSLCIILISLLLNLSFSSLIKAGEIGFLSYEHPAWINWQGKYNSSSVVFCQSVVSISISLLLDLSFSLWTHLKQGRTGVIFK